MENASKAIGLAVGAILFIIAVTVTIVMYSNMINTVNQALSINNIKTNIVEGNGNTQVVYTRAELYYLLNGLSKATDVDAYDGLTIPTLPLTGNTFTVTYTYSYNDSGINSLNNHKITYIQIETVT